MSFVTLQNPGLIPLEAVTTMGVSAKEGENPIGFFGTGLKYAVAALLRTGQRITIWRGLERFDFTAETAEVRGKSFEFVHMTGPGGAERLGFTTHLGAHWEQWQIFRELYSNCLDEGGEMQPNKVSPGEGWTTIWIEGAAFAAAARDRATYFLSSPPLYEGALVTVHPGRSSALYYRGVRVATLPRPSALTYNLTCEMTLTEDRTLAHVYSAESYIAYTLANCRSREVLEKALVNREGFEGGLSFADPCAVFGEVVLDLCERVGIAGVSPEAVGAAEAWAQKNARVKAIDLSASEAREVEDAKAFLGSIGYTVTAPIVVAETLGAGVAGLAKHDTIYLSRMTLNRGGNYLIGTILEEHLHLTHGFLDETRRFQDFLIDLVVKFAKDAAPRREPALVLAASAPANEVAA